MGSAEFDQVAANAWRRSVQADRERELSSNLVADIWMGRKNAIVFDAQINEWIGTERAFLTQTRRLTDGADCADDAEKAIGKIAKAIRKKPNAIRIKVALSGLDILALNKIVVEPSGWVSGDVIVQYTQAREFLSRVENAYIESPYKYDHKKGVVGKTAEAIKKGFQKKVKW